MTDSEQPKPPTIRSQAGEDDARLEARMKAIMEKQTPAPKKRSSDAAGKPDWLKNKPKARTAPEPAAEKTAAKKARPKAPAVKPARNSEDSWRLAAEHIARKDEENQ